LNPGPAVRIALVVAGLAACKGGAGPDAMPPDLGDAGACTSGTHLLYLAQGGGSYSPGATDARANTAEVLPGTAAVDVQPYPWAPVRWDNMVLCVKNGLAPFDVQVTEDDPGTADHWEMVLTTSSHSMGLADGLWTASPLTCGLIPDGISFIFAGTLGTSSELSCMAVLSEFGHLQGLEHVIACDDVMGEEPGCDLEDPGRSYTDKDAHCGITGPTSCMCDRGPAETQNSWQGMIDALGPCPD